MAAKIGLALSGGGSKGAFAVGVLEVIQQILDPVPYPVISGTSTGSLIGSLLTTNQFTRLKEIYTTVVTENIVNPNHSLVAAIAGPEAVLFAAAVLGGRAIFDTTALRKSIEANVDFNKIKARQSKTLLIYNTVNLQTGELVTFDNKRHSAKMLKSALLASANMPVLTDPVDIKVGGKDGQHVDGGVREYLPLRAVFGSGRDLDHIIAISTAPIKPTSTKFPIDGITEILTRTIALLDSEVGRDDLHGALLFNSILRMIENAERQGMSRNALLRGIPSEVRRRIPGKRAVPITFIGPKKHLPMDALEFDPAKMKKARKDGIAVGKKAVPRIAAALEGGLS